ncbi:Minor extracellular protease Epr [Colletotrichum fructicola Nara gc5]|uniref:Minor extracellular protease Epr n=1 Tax=Colletotrichum fructicola (strain Nara gc5) TaxID=1213859 RepID=A0A7J6IUH9_COLFN|nr:Minor extracellular protease Epr [Colletotrichum fructicola]KAF4480260.1 Minor extracellular protease Epr [Colletotrichum fructicola Nara gc5]
MASNETRDHGDQSTWCQSNDPQCGSSTELSQTGQEKGDANCETSGGDGRILDDGLKDTSPGEQSKDPTRVPSGANQVQDDNDSGNASDETIQEPNATRETSAHQEAEQRKIRADAENRGLEQTKNLSLQDFKRAITKAADQMQEGEKKAHEKAQEASQTILDAMLWDVIKELPRDDYHILLAKHHLATCYFHMENYTQAEEFYREVLKAREAKKPSDPDLILRVRRDLVATLIRSAKRKDEKEDFLAEGMYTEAMNLAMQNINDATNSTPENDVDDVYTCLETLIEQVTPETKEHAELLKSSVYAQIRLGSGMTIDDWEGVKEAGIQAWNIYVFAEGDETTAHDIYDTIQTRLEDYQASSQEPNSPDCTEAIRIGDELRTEWKKSMTKARWQKALQAAKDQARQTIAVRRRLMINKWNLLAQELLEIKGESDITKVGEHERDNIRALETTPTGIETRDIEKNEEDEQEQERLTRALDGPAETGLDRTGTGFSEYSEVETPMDLDSAASLFDIGSESSDIDEKAIDEDGHGTFIAGIVLQLAPLAELSVARVTRSRDSMRTDPQIEGENKVTAAILHAIDEWKTDIISISFGYQSIRTEELRNAIRKAIFQNVIVFGAAGNFGNTRANVSFPARLAGVFKIFACNHHGRGSSFSANGTANSSYCFSTLGTNVVSIWPEDHREAANNDEAAKKGDIRIVDMPKQKGLWVAMSGTSFATPIAASLAAIIYQFYDVNKLIMSMPPSLKFKTVDVVRAVLLQMSMEADIDRYNYLNPAVGRDNFFNFREGRGEDRVSFFARKLADCIWAADI